MLVTLPLMEWQVIVKTYAGWINFLKVSSIGTLFALVYLAQ